MKMHINPKKIIELGIVKPVEQTLVQQVGIDLTTSRDIELNHTEFENFVINEEIEIPDNLFALVWSRSTFNRRGIIIRGVVLDPGYHGRPSFSVYNLSGEKVLIPKNERVLQILFFECNPAKPYAGQYQGEGI